MKLPSLHMMKRPTWVEMVVSCIFVLYIVLPVSTPTSLVPIVQSPVGLISIFCIVLSLFLFAHPILAVLYLVVAYMLLRRSSSSMPLQKTVKKNTPPTLPVIPIPENSHNPVQSVMAGPDVILPSTLEEDVISNMAPVGVPSTLVRTSFKPVLSNIQGASPAI